MIDSYWDLYVAYIDKCVRDNWINDIDPHHYRMEWNHFLPRCIFGDWPIGHYLTPKQHAISSALQTLAFNRNCMCPWHKKHLPEELMIEAWPLFGRDTGRKAVERLNSEKDELGRCVNGVRSAQKLHQVKTKEGKSAHGVKSGLKTLEIKKGIYGRSKQQMLADSRKGGLALLEGGKGLFGRSEEKIKEDAKKGAKASLSQVWESTIDGFQGNAGNVARHNRANGWDPGARIRVS
jgi:hypothetical protein